MRVLFVGRQDSANVSNRVARALNRSAGKTVARVLTETRHPFGYAEDLIGDKGIPWEIHEFVAEPPDWIVTTDDAQDHAYFRMIRETLGLHDVPAAVRHPGSIYRRSHTMMDILDHKIGFDRRLMQADLYRFVEDDPKAFPMYAVAEDPLSRLPPLTARIRVGHSPSARHKKGTDAILAVLANFDIEVDLIENTTFDNAHERRRWCHIFVDQLNPDVGGFGAAAVEAMSVGCAVVADTSNVIDAVEAFFRKPPIYNAGSPERLEEVLTDLIQNPQALEAARRNSLSWCHTHSRFDAVTRYWTRLLQ